jgi:hypothetical protein
MTDQDPLRDEAHRLVAVALAAASAAANGLAGAHLSTGTAECCVCPICRVIAAMRDPSPDMAERLSEGAADLAAGVASMLRSMAGAAHRTAPGDPGAPPPEDPGDPWHQATSTGVPEPQEPVQPPRAPMARKVAKKAVRKPPRATATAPATGQDEGDEGTEDGT